ncbi:hypothetical protein NW760_014816 [Fusarium oxysporum]|nr:hypothetical protein NW760_014816 [Fusarium oxysporum]
MYHTRKATKLHDKIYALLGMCSDDLESAGMLVDYTTPWQKLFQKTINYILPQCLSISTWDDKDLAIIETMGCALGTVYHITQDIPRGDSQTLEISWKIPQFQSAGWSFWNINTSGKSVSVGDVVCLFGGSPNPTIVRPRRLYWEIIMISIHHTKPPSDYDKWELTDVSQLPGTYLSKFELIWDWNIEVSEQPPEQEARPRYGFSKIMLCTPSNIPCSNQQTSLFLSHNKQGTPPDKEYRLYEIIQIASIGHRLFTLAHQESEAYFKESLRILDGVISGWEAPETTENYDDLVKGNKQELDLILNTFIGILGGWLPLHWAIEDRHYYAAGWLLPHADPNVEIKDGRTPLTWAASEGYDDVIRLVLYTGKAAPDSPDNKGQTPLLLASRRGHDTVVKLLLETGEVQPDAKGVGGRTPLLIAALKNYETVVKLLLETGKVDPNAREDANADLGAGRTPLMCAAQTGHVGIARLLLEHEEVDINVRDDLGATPYEWALLKGYEDIYHLMADRLDSNARENLNWGLEKLRKKIKDSPYKDLTKSWQTSWN